MTAGNVGYASMQVIPSFRGVSAMMERELAGIMPQVGQRAGAAAGAGFTAGMGRALKIGGPLVLVTAALAKSIGTAADFEQKLSAVAAVSSATGGQLDSLREKALQLGADTSFSASESATAMEELVKAGVSVEGVLGGAADAAVALAAAGGVDLATAAEIAANSMNTFNLAAGDLPRIADLVAGAANASAIDVNDFGFSLAAAGSVADLVGLSFEDMTVGITALGNAGIKGSDAGTSLKAMLMRLEPTTDRAATLMSELGIVTADGANQFFDASGRMKSLADVSGVLRTALEGQTEQQKLATLNTLFGSDAIRAAAVLYDEGAEGIRGLNEELGKTSAADVAATRLDNLKGDLEQLSGSIETLAINVGSVAIPFLRDLASGAVDVVNVLSDPPEGFFDPLIGAGRDLVSTGENIVDLFGELVDAGRPAVELGAKLGGALVVGGLTVFAEVLERTTGFLADHSDAVIVVAGAYAGLRATFVAQAAWTVIAGGAQAATTSVVVLRGAIASLAATRGVTMTTASFGVMRASIAAATTGVTGLALGVGALAGAAALGYVQWQKWGQAGRDMAEQSGISTLRDGIDGTASSYSSMAAKAREAAADLRAASDSSSAPWDADYRRQLDEGAAAYERFAQESEDSAERVKSRLAALRDETGLNAEGLARWAERMDVDLMPSLADASFEVGDLGTKIAEARAAAQTATPVTESLATATKIMGDETETATAKLGAWKDLVEELFGGNLSIFDAQTQYGESLAKLEETLKANAYGQLDASTEAGRANRSAISGAANDALALAQAFQEAGRSDEAAFTIGSIREQLLGASEAAGFAREDFSGYLELLGLTPKQIETLIKATLDPEGYAAAEAAMSELARNRVARITALFTASDANGERLRPGRFNAERQRRWGGIDHYQAGGVRQAVMGKGKNMIWWDEPATGGEAYVPRLGNKGRSTSILATAAGWYGLSLVPQRSTPMALGGITGSATAAAPASSTSPGVTFTGDIKLDGGTNPRRNAMDLIDAMNKALWLRPSGVGG